MINGVHAHNTFWPHTGFAFIQQLSQGAIKGEQGCLCATGPLKSSWGHKGSWQLVCRVPNLRARGQHL